MLTCTSSCNLLLVGLNLLGVPGVWLFIVVRTLKKIFFLMKLSMGKAEESKGTKMSLWEVYYWNQILEICFFSTADVLYLKSPLFWGLIIKLLTPWVWGVKQHQSTGKTFTRGKSSKGHLCLPPGVWCFLMDLSTFWQSSFKIKPVVAEIKIYFLS